MAESLKAKEIKSAGILSAESTTESVYKLMLVQASKMTQKKAEKISANYETKISLNNADFERLMDTERVIKFSAILAENEIKITLANKYVFAVLKASFPKVDFKQIQRKFEDENNGNGLEVLYNTIKQDLLIQKEKYLGFLN